MNELREVVLDASALLAFLYAEPGGEIVEPYLERSSISSVNWTEVLQQSLYRGVPVQGLKEDMEALGLEFHPYTTEDAETSADLWLHTRALGLSLGDRACLALALRLGVPAVTADRAWTSLEANVEVMLIR